jgi:nucleoside-diphosphate-sugar epimerase
MVRKHNKATVLVLGAKGRLGQAAVRAFAAAGWHVIAQARTPFTLAATAGIETLECDALDTEKLLAAASQVDVIVHALNPGYARWDRLLPPTTAAVLRTAKASGRLLMVPGNVYNFGANLPPLLTENTPFSDDTAKAAQRNQMEQSIAAQANEGVQSVVIRAGDFIGGSGTWLNMAITKSLGKGAVTRMGSEQLEHAWAYLPDLAEVFVRVAEQRETLAGYQAFHYPGITATGQQLHAALEAICGRQLRAKALPWTFLKVIGLFSPKLRAALQMRYLWQRAHRLAGTRLEALIGPLPKTTLQAALEAALA